MDYNGYVLYGGNVMQLGQPTTAGALFNDDHTARLVKGAKYPKLMLYVACLHSDWPTHIL